MTTPATLPAQLIPFSFAKLPVRGRLLRLAGLGQHVAVLREPTTPQHITESLCSLLTAAALLAADSRKPGQAQTYSATLQVQHPALGALLFASCSAAGALKAYANPTALEIPFADLIRTPGGLFAVTLTPHDSYQTPSQSFVPLTFPTVAQCVAHWYEQSVQTATSLQVFIGTDAAAQPACGLFFLQKLPGEPMFTPDELADGADDDWTRLSLLASTLKPAEVLPGGPTPERLLHQLFNEDDVTLFPAELLTFQADDPRPRMLTALAGLPPAELAELLQKDGQLTLTDETSGRQEVFSAAELTAFTKANLS